MEPADQTSGSASPNPPLETPRAILLFDGVCNLCNGFVNFVLDHDSDGEILLGALQSEAAQPYLRAFDMDRGALGTVVLIENGQLYTRSTAALRVLRRLDAPWPLLSVFIAVPQPLRDWVYDRIAENRYRWFGTREECRRPTPELKARFLEDPTT